MGFIISGKRKVSIGSFEAFMYTCPFCEQYNSTTIHVFATYYHVFWIPFFPYAKEAIAICDNCNSIRDELKFGPKLVQDYRDNKGKIKYPWWTWILTILLVGFIVSLVIS